MPVGIRYSFTYIHARKEVVGTIQIGSMPPFEVVMSAEGFYQDITFISKDKGLAKLMAIVKERKDLPIDYDFGSGGSGFNSKEWEGKMGGESG